MKSENINELAAALSKAQAEIVGAKKDSKNDFFKSKYADLASVWDAIREPLSKNGLSVIQSFEGMTLITTLMHISGQWFSSTIPIMAMKQDPQSIGSAISYYRRYTLTAIVGVAQIDDDAQEASTPLQQTQQSILITPCQQSNPNTNYEDTWAIPTGKHKGKLFDNLMPNERDEYARWLKENAVKTNRALEGWALEFVKRASRAALASTKEAIPESFSDQDIPF